MSRRALAARLLVLVGVGSLTGCAVEPMTAQVADRQPRALGTHVGGCAIRMTPLLDSRSDSSVFGTVGGRTVKAPPDFEPWMRSMLMGLEKLQIRVQFADAETPAPPLTAQVDLKSAWVASVATSKKASVVLAFTYRSSTGEPQSRQYRGGVSSVDWVAGQGEIQSMIDESFSRALAQAAVDIKAACDVPISG